MECNKVREKLNFYIEGGITAREKALLEEHLKSCEECGSALSDLRKTIEHINKLEEVEPPARFTQKVMAQVRAEAGEKRGLFRKLFYPLHTKLPLEAFATVLVVIAVMYIFKAIQPEIKIAQAPRQEIAEKTLSAKKEVRLPSPSAKKEKEITVPAPSQVRGKKRRAPVEEKEDVAISEKDRMLTAAPLKKVPAPGERKSIAEKLSEKPHDIAPAPGREAAEGIAKKEDRRERPTTAAEIKTSGEKGKAMERTERVQIHIMVKDIQAARKETEGIIEKLGGKIIKSDSFGNKRVLTAALEAEQLEALHKRLNVFGDIQEEKLITGNAAGVLRIEIIIISLP